MGFWDNVTQSDGLSYIDSAEKATLIKNGTPFQLLRVFHGTGQYGPKYTAVVLLDGEERAMSFTAGSVESRDRFFDAAIDYLEDEDAEPINAVLKKIGKSQVFEQA